MVRIPTKVPGMVRQGGAAGCFGFGASGSLRIYLGMDFGHFLVNHREEKIEVGSVPLDGVISVNDSVSQDCNSKHHQLATLESTSRTRYSFSVADFISRSHHHSRK